MSLSIHRHDEQPIDPELLTRWRQIPVAVIVDLAPARQIDPGIRPLLPAGRQPAMFGRAMTVRCAPPDFGAVLHATGAIRPGQVLMIEAGGDCSHAMIGDILAGHLHRRGGAGLVCDGAVRDVHGLAGMEGFSVHCRAVNPLGPTTARAGEVNAPVTLGGCEVAPGDLIIGDDDGLAALPPALLPQLIEAAEAKLTLEAEWTARLVAGDPVADIFGLG
ncbi:Regulator of RNase E activity RraA [Paracoccus halophilus]|uniref:Putative 4-hydroxy-4-methyl-2-oxoglutarate aldolase n=1 Tax=Paracoccus halophilus TaxID=376733 RepID=A0A099EXF1_9RHOB|nr:dimethylmenaquinone methyltransferase [Paracoccus halophilus]KGJ03090.1 dimethylmenaquinone methyltransferase [Paracoccus halophilus]SFA53072.1 Regulator of RNase E activity RraA [Paracoccus halophilus]